jgi:phage-related minor tail protein
MAQKTVAEQFVDAVKKTGTSGNLVDDLFDRAYAVKEAKEQMFETQANIRDSLRALDGGGALSAAQSKELLELFPPRVRGGNGDDAEQAA